MASNVSIRVITAHMLVVVACLVVELFIEMVIARNPLAQIWTNLRRNEPE